MPANAAQEYFERRKQYRDALKAIDKSIDPALRPLLKGAMTEHVRAKFRYISKKLTGRMGCTLSTLGQNLEVKFDIEHAIPLRLIHDRILEIGEDGTPDTALEGSFPNETSIERFVTCFVVGVIVSENDHGLLKANKMHEGWVWPNVHAGMDWETALYENWDFNSRADWMKVIMDRYEKAASPASLFQYGPPINGEFVHLDNKNVARYWSAVFGVSVASLRRVIAQVGNSVPAVRQALQR